MFLRVTALGLLLLLLWGCGQSGKLYLVEPDNRLTVAERDTTTERETNP